MTDGNDTPIEMGRTNYGKLCKIHARMFELTGALATLRLPVEVVSGIVEGLTALTQEVGDITQAVKVTDSGRGQHFRKLENDPRSPEEIKEDNEAGIEVVL